MTRLRADEVVGGLWDGAPVEATWWEADESDPGAPATLGGTWHSGHIAAGDDLHEPPFMHHPREGLHLRLDDERGLGMAGLAWALEQRVGRPDRSHDLPEWLDCQDLGPWDPWRMWPSWREVAELSPEVVVAVSQYLALTDRLCGLVGLALQPGEVAGWEGDEDVWVLFTQRGHGVRLGDEATTRYVAIPTNADWLAALRASVEVLHG